MVASMTDDVEIPFMGSISIADDENEGNRSSSLMMSPSTLDDSLQSLGFRDDDGGHVENRWDAAASPPLRRSCPAALMKRQSGANSLREGNDDRASNSHRTTTTEDDETPVHRVSLPEGLLFPPVKPFRKPEERWDSSISELIPTTPTQPPKRSLSPPPPPPDDSSTPNSARSMLTVPTSPFYQRRRLRSPEATATLMLKSSSSFSSSKHRRGNKTDVLVSPLTRRAALGRKQVDAIATSWKVLASPPLMPASSYEVPTTNKGDNF